MSHADAALYEAKPVGHDRIAVRGWSGRGFTSLILAAPISDTQAPILSSRR